jgi:ribonucleotide reductase alpha subunit
MEAKQIMVQTRSEKNALHELGYKIFLDRYAQKDMKRETLAVGDTVIVVVDAKTGQREVGRITALHLPQVEVTLLDGTVVKRDVEHVDKPLETDPAQMMERVAAGIAAVEATPALRKQWAEQFRWALEDWKFVPAGRILAAAGTEQELTYYNCYVIPSPKDSRGGIIETLRQMTEIMSRGGGVGINVSSLRPRHAYVKGVNGRSSGAVSWGALYSFVTGLIEQGGCFGPQERILTDKGLIPAQELADRMDNGEVFQAHTHKGLRPITARFRNGIKPLFEVTTSRGYRVRITEDHKVAVLADGRIVTTPLKYLQPGDEILLLLGEGVNGDYVPLKPVEYSRSLMSTTLNENVTLPQILDEELAYLLGYMYGDGYVHVAKKVTWQAPKAIKLATADAYPAIRQRLIVSIERLFGLSPTIEERPEAATCVSLYSRLVIEWLKQNGILKPKAESVTVPEAIFRSPSSVMAAFIAGYFDADGCDRGKKGGYGIDSVSRPILEDIQQLLALNGIVSRITAQDRSIQGWRTLYRLSITGGTFKRRFAEWIPAEKVSTSLGTRDMYQTYPAKVWKNLGARSKYHQRIYDGVSERISFGQLSRIQERLLDNGQAATAEQIGELLHTIPDIITDIQLMGSSDVYDFEVDDVHLLSGAGIYTSNSRRGALMLILNDTHPDIFDFINSKRTAGQITNANISVGISDRFMDAVKANADWDLVFPDTSYPDYDDVWDGDLEKWEASGRRVLHYRTVKARDLWNAIIESAWASAEPGVWFRERSNKMSNSHYYSSLVSTNPCGEQPLPAFGVCNLGAINLAKFYDPKTNDVLWDDLDRTARISTRFLDNVIDSTPYFFEPNRQQQLSERRVGLNTMGIAELMIKLGIRYGSDESVAFIDKLYSFLVRAVYETSADIAAEKGAFPRFDAEKFLQSGFMQSLPADIREKVRKQGIRNVTLLTQAPTGCVAPDTLISTAKGMRPIVDMGDPDGPQWQIMMEQVHTDTGLRQTSHFYVNGYQPVKKITTKRGFSLTATPNHRIRVIDAYGDYVWRRMDELRLGDRVVLKKNTLGQGERVALTPVEQGNRALSALPEAITPDFAEMIGLYMGDGYLKDRGGIHIVVSKQDPDLLRHVQELLQKVWGEERHTAVEDRPGCWMVNLTGYYIPRFFAANGLDKPRGNHGEGAEGAFIPAKILQAGRDCVAAFLRGLFEADGSVYRGTITLSSTSRRLIDQVQVALLGLGIVSTVREMPEQTSSFGSRAKYELRILNRREATRFVETIGFISQRKTELAHNLGTLSDRGDSIPVPALCEEFYGESKGLKNEVRQQIVGLVSNGALTQQFIRETAQAYPTLQATRLAQLVALDVYLDEVAAIADSACYTYDLSVPDNQTYIANGFVSHNTTGTMVNTSTGIEPFFSWVYYRKSRLGLHEEQVPIVKEWYDSHPGATQLPDYFVTAMDLTPQEHIRVQAAIQRWVDSSISKTANVPNEYTVEQVSDLYMYMYELGCKGGTIYRDGSRDEQVLMLKGDERAEKEMTKKSENGKPAEEKIEQVSTPHKVYPRPKQLAGVTISRKTPFGTAYITMNSDDQGNPFEVFITVGKAGSDLQADAEGLGRMISLQLRTTAPQNRMSMLKLIIEQLSGIGGARSVGLGPQRVSSLPDVVASALTDHYLPQNTVKQLGLPINGNHAPAAEAPTTSKVSTDPVSYSGADMCPECQTYALVRAEGCRTCLNCGYSEC